MIKSIRHLCGSEDQWRLHDAVIPNAEIAIVKTKGGNQKIKIGNGRDKFSALPCITGESVRTDAETVTLLHARSYRLKTAYALEISFPEEIDDDYYSEISFDSGDDATEFSVNGKLRLSGDDVAGGELIPCPNTHYTVFVWYDGNMQGVVRGLPDD